MEPVDKGSLDLFDLSIAHASLSSMTKARSLQML